MGDAEITTSQWRLVEVGRVVLFSTGTYEGRLAAIVEIIDHKRVCCDPRSLPSSGKYPGSFEQPLTWIQVLVDGPASSKDKVVPRHSAPLSSLSLTPIVISKLPRAAGNGVVKKLWEKDEIDNKFENSSWAKSRSQFAKRKQLNDFERFKVMKLRKQVG